MSELSDMITDYEEAPGMKAFWSSYFNRGDEKLLYGILEEALRDMPDPSQRINKFLRVDRDQGEGNDWLEHIESLIEQSDLIVVNLSGDPKYGVDKNGLPIANNNATAELLYAKAKGIPFVILTKDGDRSIPVNFRHLPNVVNYDPKALETKEGRERFVKDFQKIANYSLNDSVAKRAAKGKDPKEAYQDAATLLYKALSQVGAAESRFDKASSPEKSSHSNPLLTQVALKYMRKDDVGADMLLKGLGLEQVSDIHKVDPTRLAEALGKVYAERIDWERHVRRDFVDIVAQLFGKTTKEIAELYRSKKLREMVPKPVPEPVLKNGGLDLAQYSEWLAQDHDNRHNYEFKEVEQKELVVTGDFIPSRNLRYGVKAEGQHVLYRAFSEQDLEIKGNGHKSDVRKVAVSDNGMWVASYNKAGELVVHRRAANTLVEAQRYNIGSLEKYSSLYVGDQGSVLIDGIDEILMAKDGKMSKCTQHNRWEGCVGEKNVYAPVGFDKKPYIVLMTDPKGEISKEEFNASFILTEELPGRYTERPVSYVISNDGSKVVKTIKQRNRTPFIYITDVKGYSVISQNNLSANEEVLDISNDGRFLMTGTLINSDPSMWGSSHKLSIYDLQEKSQKVYSTKLDGLESASFVNDSAFTIVRKLPDKTVPFNFSPFQNSESTIGSYKRYTKETYQLRHKREHEAANR